MKRIGKASRKADTRLEVTPYYFVRSAGNGLIIGSVRYSFFNGDHWCFSIRFHNGTDGYAKTAGEYEPFEVSYGSPPWLLPVPNSAAMRDLEMLTAARREIEQAMAVPKALTGPDAGVS